MSPAHDSDRWRPLLDEVDLLRGRRCDVHELPGGLTNVNLGVVRDDGLEVVVRVAQPGNDVLGIDRDRECHNARAAAESSVAPRVLEYPRPGLLVVARVEGRTLTAGDLRDADRLRRVAETVRNLHAGKGFRGDLDLRAVQRRYRDVVVDHGLRTPAGYFDHVEDADRVADALTIRPLPRVPCHNDLVAGNFIDDGDRLWLVDFEYSANNDPTFDLGNLWAQADLELEHLGVLVETYGAPAPRRFVARARLWGLLSRYTWTLWACIEDAVSSLEADFWSWGVEQYERALAELGGPDLEGLLAEVSKHP